MSSKGIAIRVILLLLIGTIVVGLLIFYLYKVWTGSTLTREECRTRAVSWCTACWNAMGAAGCADTWSGAGCDVGPKPSPELQKCSDDYYTQVTACTGNKGFCGLFIPV